jgi:hypothetical protein
MIYTVILRHDRSNVYRIPISMMGFDYNDFGQTRHDRGISARSGYDIADICKIIGDKAPW